MVVPSPYNRDHLWAEQSQPRTCTSGSRSRSTSATGDDRYPRADGSSHAAGTNPSTNYGSNGSAYTDADDRTVSGTYRSPNSSAHHDGTDPRAYTRPYAIAHAGAHHDSDLQQGSHAGADTGADAAADVLVRQLLREAVRVYERELCALR